MKVKFVHDGDGAPRKHGKKEMAIEMKTLPHAGERVRLGEDGVFEVVSIIHTPEEQEFAAVAAVRPVPQS